MKIILAGGSGLLGKSIMSSLEGKGHEIFILTRKKTDTLNENISGFQFINWDPTKTGDWVSQLEKSDIIINLVGLTLASGIRWSKNKKKKLLESRTIPTKTLAKAVCSLTHKPSLFIQISGINYYDFSFDQQDETSPLGSSFLSQMSESWEKSSLDIETCGIRRVIIRLAPVIAKESILIKLIKLPYLLFVGGRYGLKGDQWFSWIDKDDFVRFIEFSIQNNISGAFNLSSPEPIQNKVMNKIIGKTLKRPWFFPVPGFVLRLFLGQKSDLLLKSIRVVSVRLSEEGFTFSSPSFAICFRNQMKPTKK
jgi:hypothetical protein